MAAVGILAADKQVELIAGQITQRTPKGPRHSAICKRLETLLEGHLGDRALVRVQDPIQLDRYSEPEPDLAIVRPSTDFYTEQHPSPEGVYLLIEVADIAVRNYVRT